MMAFVRKISSAYDGHICGVGWTLAGSGPILRYSQAGAAEMSDGALLGTAGAASDRGGGEQRSSWRAESSQSAFNESSGQP